MVGESEDGGAALGLVGADPLEHARAVMQPVCADVNRRVGPVDQLAVHPDLFRLEHVAAVPSVGCWRYESYPYAGDFPSSGRPVGHSRASRGLAAKAPP